MSVVELLWRLQELDTSLQELGEEEMSLPLRREVEGMEEELSGLLSELEKSKKELEGLRERLRRGEKKVEELTSRIVAEEDRLYGGKVSNPKELRSIQAEVQALKRKKDQEETGLLEMMERAEEQEAFLGELGSKRSALLDRLEKARSNLGEELQRIGAGQEQLRFEMERLREKIPPDILSLYDELIASKNGLAVAKVLEGTCQGCHITLPAQEYDRFIRSDGIFRCSNCRRILVA